MCVYVNVRVREKGREPELVAVEGVLLSFRSCAVGDLPCISCTSHLCTAHSPGSSSLRTSFPPGGGEPKR